MTQPVFPFRALLPLAIATALAIFGMGVIIPILPFYVTSMGGSEEHAPYIFSLFSLSALIASPFWGALSDRYGRKSIMILALIGTIISYLWLGFATSLWQLYAARIVAGLSAGWMATSQAYISDVTHESQRAKGMGMMGAAFGIGFTLGPGLGAILFANKQTDSLVASDFTIPSMLALTLSLLAVILVFFKVKEPEKQKHNLQKEENLIKSHGFFSKWINIEVLKAPGVFPFIFLYFAVFLVFTAVEGVFAIWAFVVLDYGPKEVGILLSYSGLITIFVQGGLIGKLSSRFGEQVVVRIGITSLFFSLIIFSMTTSLIGLIVAISLLSLAMGLHSPAMQSLISRVAPIEYRGSVMGTAQSTMSMARVLGPAWGTLAFGFISPQAPFWIGAIFLIILTLIANYAILKKK